MRTRNLSLKRAIAATLPSLPSAAFQKVETCLKLASLGENFTPFSTLSLLATGFWYSFEPLAAYTNTAATIKANVGDAIGALNCWTSANRDVTQSLASARPTLLSEGASFNSTDRTFLIGTNNLTFGSFTSFSVCNLDINSRGAVFANQNNANNTTGGWFYGVSSGTGVDTDGNFISAGLSGSGGGLMLSTSTATGSKRLLGISRFPNTSRIWNNNAVTHVSQSTTLSSNSISGGFQIGGYFRSTGSINRHCTGTIFGVISFSSFLSESQRRQVAKFLNAYYSIGVSF